jgi:hypothetical protein
MENVFIGYGNKVLEVINAYGKGIREFLLIIIGSLVGLYIGPFATTINNGAIGQPIGALAQAFISMGFVLVVLMGIMQSLIGIGIVLFVTLVVGFIMYIIHKIYIWAISRILKKANVILLLLIAVVEGIGALFLVSYVKDITKTFDFLIYTALFILIVLAYITLLESFKLVWPDKKIKNPKSL